MNSGGEAARGRGWLGLKFSTWSLVCSARRLGRSKNRQPLSEGDAPEQSTVLQPYPSSAYFWFPMHFPAFLEGLRIVEFGRDGAFISRSWKLYNSGLCVHST
jgi:hypothetical protein